MDACFHRHHDYWRWENARLRCLVGSGTYSTEYLIVGRGLPTCADPATSSSELVKDTGELRAMLLPVDAVVGDGASSSPEELSMAQVDGRPWKGLLYEDDAGSWLLWVACSRGETSFSSGNWNSGNGGLGFLLRPYEGVIASVESLAGVTSTKCPAGTEAALSSVGVVSAESPAKEPIRVTICSVYRQYYWRSESAGMTKPVSSKSFRT